MITIGIPTVRIRPLARSKYEPHYNSAECQRHLRQVRRGQLDGKRFVSEQARYAAHGLVHPAMRLDGETDR